MERVYGHHFRRTTLVAIFCVSALTGLGLARFISWQALWLVPGLVLLVTLMWRRSLATLAWVIVFGLCCGGVRGTATMHQLRVNQAHYNQTVSIVGVAGADGVYGASKQLSFDLQNVHLSHDGAKLVGKISVGGFGENMVFRGDTVSVTGKLRPGSGSYQARMSFVQLHVVSHSTSFIEKVRRSFNAGMLTALPEPLASFGMGLLIGQHSSLPKDIYQDLLMVGLVHIIAVSGYNLTIILRACWRLLGNRSKYQMVLVSMTLIGTFLMLTGSSASIVRASIVSTLSLAAWYYGRSFRPVVLILLTAAITGLWNPLYVWSDIGWYLSFLAFYGVMAVAPLIRVRWFPKRWQDSVLLSIALESLCAEIMTLPLVLYVFGQMSLVSLVANVLIAVFVPIAMLLTMIAGLAGTLFLPVAGWLAWPATIVLTYMLDTAHVLGRIPHVFLQNIGFSLLAMIAAYALVLVFNLLLHSRTKRNSAIINIVNGENLES